MHGDFAARSELVALSDDETLIEELNRLENASQVAPASLWRRFVYGLDLNRLLGPPARIETMIADPLLATVALMANARTCQWLARRALPQMQAVQVHVEGAHQLAADPHRTNTAMSFRLDNTGLPVLALRERVAAVLGVRVAQLEPTQVLRYEPSQSYDTHFDAFADDEAGRALMAASGQRIATLLVSLNANYEGGETEFPTLGARYRGVQGQCVFWSNADPAGRRDERTAHAGLTPRGASNGWCRNGCAHGTMWNRAADPVSRPAVGISRNKARYDAGNFL